MTTYSKLNLTIHAALTFVSFIADFFGTDTRLLHSACCGIFYESVIQTNTDIEKIHLDQF